ncbi:2-amino-4-hydroxy-6-hydroxymethyldihydropteridine diphosphokinase [bacterium]|nr:2-amino-4-hydroxy-6-hydroxymethyldihydropteridine diphosphokinase [bacterium]
MVDCLIAFGSNQGDREGAYEAAVNSLNQHQEVEVVAVSKLHVTAAVGGPGDQSSYLNGAIRLSTRLGENDLHQLLIQTENDLGRVRLNRWGARTIDLDLLLYGENQISTPKLTVPHPRMSFRRFVLEPASEIAAEMIHPPSRLTIGQLIQRIATANRVVLCLAESSLNETFAEVEGEFRAKFGPAWTLEQVDQCDQINGNPKNAVLMAFFALDGSEIAPCWLAANSFKGPMLELPRDPGLAKQELFAAIEAIQ